jgi:predicted DNA-binding protein
MAQKSLNPRGGESPLISARLVAEDARRLDQLAQRRKMTRAAVVRELVRQGLTADQDTGPPGDAAA